MHVVDGVLIGGAWVPAERGTYDVVDPSTEQTIGKAPSASVAQVEAAAKAARAAQPGWARLSPEERGALLGRAAERFRREMKDLVELTIAETGAVRRVAELQQVGAVPARLARYAQLAAESPDTEMPRTEVAGRATAGVVVREPVGVVAAITPFNFPMTNCAGKIGPALACGNTVVVKPAPVDPLGVAELCRIVASELPPGVVNFVCGPGPEIGAALVESPDVDMISFTGSTTVGLEIQKTAASRMKRTLLELGGKSANVIFADADRERALASAMSVWTFHTGQICIAGTRLLVEQSIYREFTEELAKRAATIRIGDPRETETVMGPLVSSAHRDRVERCIAKGVAEGARLACGGKRPASPARGWYVEPTLFVDAKPEMTIVREEIFGPVVVALPFRDEAHALELANDTEFGLYGFVWSGDAERALRVARRMRTGPVQTNGAMPNPEAPFGGVKLSGIGRDGGRFALSAYSELKYIGVPA